MSTHTSSIPIKGEVKEGFERVEEQFRKNFTERGELGAACSIYYRGDLVVDLWGGYKKEGTSQPWEEDTIVLTYSVTKGLSALATAVAVSRGYLHYEAPVTSVWPEFGQNGKASILIKDLISQRAGLCAVNHRMNASNLGDLSLVSDLMAAERPEWKVNDFSGNHPYSIGWIHSQLLRRSDPYRRSLRTFFRDEVAAPLGATFYIGLPSEFDHTRIARIKGFESWKSIFHMKTLPWKMVLLAFLPWTLTFRALNNPFFWNPADLDSPDYWPIENGGAGGMGTARGVASIYSGFALRDKKLGLTNEVFDALCAKADKPRYGWEDRVLKTNLRYSMGLEKPDDSYLSGCSPRSFGTFGIGGSLGFADPDAEVGFAYLTNKLGFTTWNDPRQNSLREAFYDCISGN